MNDTPTIKALCWCVFDNVAMVYLDMIQAVRDEVNIEPSFVLAFEDEAVSEMLNHFGYHHVGYSFRDIEVHTKWLKLPFVRLLAREIFYYHRHKLILSKLAELGKLDFSILFYSDLTDTVGKYFLRYCRRRKVLSFHYEYGVAARNTLLKELRIVGRTRLIRVVKSFEQMLYTVFLRLLSLVPSEWRFSVFNKGWDYLLVRADVDKENVYQNYHVPKHRIRVVGSIWVHKVSYLRETKLDLKDRTNEKKTLLVLLSDSYKIFPLIGLDDQVYFRRFDQLLKSLTLPANDAHNIVVKFHPKDIIERYEPLMEKYSDNVVWIRHKEKDTHELLIKADIVIGQTSTVMLDAVYLHKPILFYSFLTDSPNADWLEYGRIYNKIVTYDLACSIDENVMRSSEMSADVNQLKKYVPDIDFVGEFSRFLLESVNFPPAD